MSLGPGNHLVYGDNLDVLRRRIPDASVDLIYLDPPFNSDATYNLVVRDPSGQGSGANIEAFEDTWRWGEAAEAAFQDVRASGHQRAAAMLVAMREALGMSDLMAYLAMMAVRLVELHRVLKPTGSLYLHCDPTASHYLKTILDGVFGAQFFTNEIIWERTNTKAHAFTRFSSSHDVLLHYRKSDQFTWNALYAPHSESYIKSHYSNVEEETGRRYTLGDTTNPNPDRPNLTYEWRGVNKVWRWTREKMQQMHDEGRLVYTKSGAPRYKRYLDEMKGTPITDVWTDIFPINSQAQERLGYPTQKPTALLERIILASSDPGHLVLDPFCGCGTTVHAAQKLGRRWIGIDVTHLAIGLIRKRLSDAFGPIPYGVHGEPADLASARQWFQDDSRDKKQWELWALSLLGDARPWQGQKKGADGGRDGVIPFGQTQKALVSVKGGGVSVKDVRELLNVLDRDKAQVGILLTLEEPTRPMLAEAAGAGLYALDGWPAVPRCQVVTIERAMALRDGSIRLPARRGDNFKAAPREAASPTTRDLFS